ncbi:IS21-like element helper ATPase IstB [uncultured Rikenella sp.]|uniref:IS21-like element helper ATPase IstB n=1 Tax=uncultured Rikenella sp. TaxID=368003 RepID=UPI002621E994|nr:IS21-like element helper ATPase IstB [uncultured Rikenella sp.]
MTDSNPQSEIGRIVATCRKLSMFAMCESLADTLEDAARDNLSHAAVLARLLEDELESRSMAAQRRRIRAAAFPQLKYLHDLVREELPDDARAALPELETLEFVKNGRNLVLYGNPGTGKTHMATALGIAACQRGYSVLFSSVPRLLTTVREAKSQHKLTQLQNRFEKYDLVVCDEFGYVSCDKEGAELLFNHLSLRAETRSTIVTTNLAFSRWNEIIPDKVLVNALVDRLTHKAKIINMTGSSYRLKQTQQMIKNQI